MMCRKPSKEDLSSEQDVDAASTTLKGLVRQEMSDDNLLTPHPESRRRTLHILHDWQTAANRTLTPTSLILTYS